MEKPTRMSRRLEVGANVAILLTCALIVTTLVRSRWLPASGAPAARNIQVGEPVRLSGVDWGANGKTLVLVLQTTCHYCTESTPLYKRIAERIATQRGVRLLAVLPQPVDVSREYLAEHGLDVHDVVQANPLELNVHATPTVLLIGRAGIVERVWVGKLSSAEAEKVLLML
jgi:hypothetical protein